MTIIVFYNIFTFVRKLTRSVLHHWRETQQNAEYLQSVIGYF